MDDPLTPESTAEPVQPVNRATRFGAVKGPDGNWYITITHQDGLASYTMGVPLDEADTYADEYAKAIHTCAADARRAKSGLVVVGRDGNGRNTFRPTRQPRRR